MIDIKLAADFGDLLDRMIRGRYLSIQSAMNVLNCSRAMVDKYRNGKSKPSAERLRKFGQKFGYDYGDLLKLAHGKDPGTGDDAELAFKVRTERGALVARMFEDLPNAEARAAIYELLSSLSKESIKTGSDS